MPGSVQFLDGSSTARRQQVSEWRSDPVDDLVDHQTVPEYNTRAVEKLTGIPADTFRAWERRHGLPNPARTAGNHRLYSERDIAIVRALKQMTDDGISISHAVAIARRRIETTLVTEPAAETPSDSDCLGDLRELHDAAALRARALEEDLRELDLARRLEQLDEVLVRRRPRQLHPYISVAPPPHQATRLTLRTMICWLGSAS